MSKVEYLCISIENLWALDLTFYRVWNGGDSPFVAAQCPLLIIQVLLPPRYKAKRPWNLFLDDRGLTPAPPLSRTGACFCANLNHAFQVWIALNLQFNKSIHTSTYCRGTRKYNINCPLTARKQRRLTVVLWGYSITCNLSPKGRDDRFHFRMIFRT